MPFKNSRGTGAGGVSILMVFVILCLVIFSALSLVSAQADLRLSTNTRNGVESYYKADANAAAVIAKIDAAIRTSGGDAAKLRAACQKIQGVTMVLGGQSGSLHILFTVPMDEGRELFVGLGPTAGQSGKTYEITSYRVVDTSEWNIDTEIKVWQGK